MAVLRALRTHVRVDRSVHVLHFFGRRVRIAETCVHADVRLHVDELAQRHKLIQAQIVGLHGIPRIVEVRRTPVDVANYVGPDEPGRVIAAIPPEARLNLAEKRSCVGPEAIDVIGRHQRKRADMKIPLAYARNLDGAVGSIGPRREDQRELLVHTGERGNHDGLPVGLPAPQINETVTLLPGVPRSKFVRCTSCH